jgi:uncharacterized protein
MFPLGTVLMPGGVLPLHVFEPRYREMVRTCLAGDGRFGVALIERGSEVGGGDVRTGVGTLAEIAQAQEAPDGRWGILAVGVSRIRVIEWLPDDPFPRAEVEEWDDGPWDGGTERLAGLLAELRRVAALKGELGDAVGPIPGELADDPVLALYQACWLAPLPVIDKQALLAAPSPEERAALLGRLLAEESDVLRLRFGGADPAV